jgi:hypothetical protein
MTKLATKPCEACPYRKDAPKGLWAPQEFLNLVRNDHAMGNAFGCHLNSAREEQDVCVGWLADQKRRGVPNVRQRLVLSGEMAPASSPPEVARFEAVDESDANLYESIDEMVLANLGKSFPSRNVKAKRLVKKLGTA